MKSGIAIRNPKNQMPQAKVRIQYAVLTVCRNISSGGMLRSTGISRTPTYRVASPGSAFVPALRQSARSWRTASAKAGIPIAHGKSRVSQSKRAAVPTNTAMLRQKKTRAKMTIELIAGFFAHALALA
jgi:hypothetical protein